VTVLKDLGKCRFIFASGNGTGISAQ